jgi:hypothetical protein
MKTNTMWHGVAYQSICLICKHLILSHPWLLNNYVHELHINILKPGPHSANKLEL